MKAEIICLALRDAWGIGIFEVARADSRRPWITAAEPLERAKRESYEEAEDAAHEDLGRIVAMDLLDDMKGHVESGSELLAEEVKGARLLAGGPAHSHGVAHDDQGEKQR
jgi:hypothetical protein